MHPVHVSFSPMKKLPLTLTSVLNSPSSPLGKRGTVLTEGGTAPHSSKLHKLLKLGTALTETILRVDLIAHIAAILLITTASALSYEQQYTQTVPLIPGTETTEIQTCKNGKAFVYDTYSIYSIRSPDFEGQNIFIFKTKEGQYPCGLNPKKAYYTIQAGEFGGANEFTGLLGNKLFIDQWTGRDHKRVLIIDLTTKSLTFFDWYDDPKIENDVLYYNKVLKGGKRTKKSIPCPEAKKWESEGLLPIYIQRARVDLSTMKRTVDEARTCKPVTPIAGAKNSSYGGH